MNVPSSCGGGERDTEDTLAERFRAHARDSKDLYGYATRGMADDWESGGPTRLVYRGYENAPRGAVIHLRLLAGVFRLVLTGRAPELLPFYPCLGGTAPASRAWPVVREVIGAHVEEIRAGLAIPPQTNEVGRSVALLAGLFDLVAASGVRRIRLLEVGASAGLNLLLDHYAYRGEGWQFGSADSKVQFVDPIKGTVRPEHFMITSRAGCDLHPVDAGTADGRLLLTSYVWPFDVDRHERLAAALEIAISHPVRVDKAQASGWLPHVLGLMEPETLTVVWHSITQMYWLPEEVAAVEAIMRSAGAEQLLGEVSLEFKLDGPDGTRPELRTRLWTLDARCPRERLLGTAHDHGVPVRLAGGSG